MPRRDISFQNKFGTSYRIPLKDICYIERIDGAVRIVYAPSNWGQRGFEKIQQKCRSRIPFRRLAWLKKKSENAIIRPGEHTAVYARPDSVILHHGNVEQAFKDIYVINHDNIPFMPGWAQFSGHATEGGNKGVFLNLMHIRSLNYKPGKADPREMDLTIHFGGTDYIFLCQAGKEQIDWLKTARNRARLESVITLQNFSPKS